MIELVSMLRDMKGRTKFGFLLTGIWVLALVAAVFVYRNKTGEMNLNEWGDFLAGGFAPLALFWLVIGYFQHGEELKQNTKALEMQEKELRRQVEETKHLVHASREELSFLIERDRRAVRPDIVFRGNLSASPSGTQIAVENRGSELRYVRIDSEGSCDLSFSPDQVFDRNSTGYLYIHHEKREGPLYPFEFSFCCVDLHGNHHIIEFELYQDSRVRFICLNSDYNTK